MPRQIRVGGAVTDLAKAKTLATAYLTPPDRIKDTRWAYPAYDAYPGGPTDDVSEQDLLGFVLLNVTQKPLPSYYALLDVLPEINTRLNVEAMDGSLLDAGEATLEAIAHLLGILDDPGIDHVRLTKLSKVLHRKRPQLIPLYDAHIWNCYTQIKPVRIRPNKNRSYADFARVWLREVQQDLRDQRSEWAEIAALAVDPPITELRALDIVGWHLGKD